jgi:hypothetical protein
MEAIERQAKALLEALIAAERRCLYYEPKEPARDADYRRASHAYGDAANILGDWISEQLLPAVHAEQDAEAEERVA